MKRLILLSASVVLLTAGAAMAQPQGEGGAAARKVFASPPREYATAPLWVWNDMLTEEQVRGTLRDLAAQKVRQAFVHPRPGLMTPYLSADWFRLWRAALDEAEKLDMNVWIYDENSYPSGFAGGHVPQDMPESRGRGLEIRETAAPPKPGTAVVGVYRIDGERRVNVTAAFRAGEKLPEGRYVVASVIRAVDAAWTGNRPYVDLMYPGVTEKFLDITLDAYKREIGDQFGKRVLGCFTDEPNIRPAGGLPWTDHLPAAFQKRWGYNLLDHLPSLAKPVGPWKRVRHDYFQVLVDQYIEHWAKPYRARCEKYGIAFTGHYWDHEWPNCVGVPDNMALNAFEHIPGIDCLMNQYREDTHAQFGNVRIVREVQSVCNQLGDKRFLCEIYGAGGWDLRFEDMKRIADWLGVLGVNLFDEHLSYVTLRGARKADHPQSFSYHEPWWNSYHVMAEYITRLSAAMTRGEQKNRILLIEPTTTAWFYQEDPTQAAKLAEVGKSFFDLLMEFERAQVEYDIGCEDIIARHGSLVSTGVHAEPKRFVVGQRQYTTIVLPPVCETLRSETVKLLKDYAASGGEIICCGPAPTLVDARPSPDMVAARPSPDASPLAVAPGWKTASPKRAAEMLVPVLGLDRCAIRRAPGDKGILFHQRRQLADGQLLLLVNTSIEAPSRGFVEAQAKAVERWDLFTGAAAPHPFVMEQGAAKVNFELPPCGSLLLFFAADPAAVGGGAAASASVTAKVSTVASTGPTEIRRVEPNVLKLDYVDLATGGKQYKNLYYYRANDIAWQAAGMKQNPWDSAVQFKDELISKKFPADSGFEATYRFTLAENVPGPLWIVIERPDLYAVSCNGKPITAAKDSWWLDKAFGKIDITALVRKGENAVSITAKPFTMYHELAAAYLLGDFSLRAAPSGFVVAPPEPLAIAKGRGWNAQGMPLYGAGVTYRQSFAVGEPAGAYVVRVPAWYGSVAKVCVNGKLCGHLVSRPWHVDVTKAIRAGENTVEVTVIGTLKNTLGPHHAGAVVGTAWPGMFRQGPEHGPPPGASYHTLGYGLFAPFELLQAK